jgi:hypothetical protein
MVMRVLEAQKWVDRWESAARDAGATPDELASLLFVAAAMLQSEGGLSLMDTCVDARRKLGCNHTDLAFVLGNTASRIHMVKIGAATR